MAVDAERVLKIFTDLGAALKAPTTLCLFGSTPGIAEGQRERQTKDLDVWVPKSAFDTGDLMQACAAAGILFDPRSTLEPDQAYIQIVRPGEVRFPPEFEAEVIGRFGNLTLVMPPPEILAASKLIRGTPVDVDDVVWWVKQRGLDASDIQMAIDRFPDPRHREIASDNIIFVELVMGSEWK